MWWPPSVQNRASSHPLQKQTPRKRRSTFLSSTLPTASEATSVDTISNSSHTFLPQVIAIHTGGRVQCLVFAFYKGSVRSKEITAALLVYLGKSIKQFIAKLFAQLNSRCGHLQQICVRFLQETRSSWSRTYEATVILSPALLLSKKTSIELCDMTVLLLLSYSRPALHGETSTTIRHSFVSRHFASATKE